MQTKSVEPPEALIGAGGVSDSWLAQKSNVKNIFNDFRLAKPAYTALAPVPLVQLSEAQMCCAALWESAATFLLALTRRRGSPRYRSASGLA